MSLGKVDGQGHHRVLAKKLRMGLLVPAVLGLIQLVVALVAIAVGDAPMWSLLVLLPAVAIGFPWGRMVRLDWDNDTAEIFMVAGQTAITVAFIEQIVAEKVILKRALSDLENIGTIVLILTAGLIFGRLLGLYQQIKTTLEHRPV